MCFAGLARRTCGAGASTTVGDPAALAGTVGSAGVWGCSLEGCSDVLRIPPSLVEVLRSGVHLGRHSDSARSAVCQNLAGHASRARRCAWKARNILEKVRQHAVVSHAYGVVVAVLVSKATYWKIWGVVGDVRGAELPVAGWPHGLRCAWIFCGASLGAHSALGDRNGFRTACTRFRVAVWAD